MGLAPQHALSVCQRLHYRSLLFFFKFSKSIWKKKSIRKKLQQSLLSVPEGHCRIIIIANFADIKKASDDQEGAPDQRPNS